MAFKYDVQTLRTTVKLLRIWSFLFACVYAPLAWMNERALYPLWKKGSG